jgi:hypothetical protein
MAMIAINLADIPAPAAPAAAAPAIFVWEMVAFAVLPW